MAKLHSKLSSRPRTAAPTSPRRLSSLAETSAVTPAVMTAVAPAVTPAVTTAVAPAVTPAVTTAVAPAVTPAVAPAVALSPAAPIVSFAEGAAAYERLRGALDGLTTEEVGIIRANVSVSVSIVFGALPNVEARLDELRRVAPGLDFDELGRLRDYTGALYYLYLMTKPGDEAPADLPALLAEASPLRARLLSMAETMALFEHVPAERVADIRRGSGHLDTADDLGSLVRLFRAIDPKLVAQTLVSEAMLGRAGELSFQLVAALGRRRVGSDGAGEPTRYEEDRARAFRLMVRAYDEARRGLTFLRWREGDADTLAPSIFAGRRRGREVPDIEAPAEGEPTGEAGPVEPSPADAP